MAQYAQSGTFIDQYDATPGSHTVFNFGQNDNKFVFPYLQLQNLGTTTFGGMTLGCGGSVATPGASPDQAGHVYNSFGWGNQQAVQSGQMGYGNAVCGLHGATAGLWNQLKGIQHNMII